MSQPLIPPSTPIIKKANSTNSQVAGRRQIAGPGWTSSTEWSKPTLVLLNTWVVGQAMVIYLAALQDVPQDLLDLGITDDGKAATAALRVCRHARQRDRAGGDERDGAACQR